MIFLVLAIFGSKKITTFRLLVFERFFTKTGKIN